MTKRGNVPSTFFATLSSRLISPEKSPVFNVAYCFLFNCITAPSFLPPSSSLFPVPDNHVRALLFFRLVMSISYFVYFATTPCISPPSPLSPPSNPPSSNLLPFPSFSSYLSYNASTVIDAVQYFAELFKVGVSIKASPL